MPRRRDHVIASGAGGFLTSIAFPVQPSGPTPWELLGGVVGGAVGGLAPDGLEPATSPNHRAFFHRGGARGPRFPVRLERDLLSYQARALAAEVALQGLTLTEEERRRWEAERNWVLFARAFVIAFLAGYGLHLLMDAATPRSLPLV